jgi:hypothetical protein
MVELRQYPRQHLKLHISEYNLNVYGHDSFCQNRH